VFELPEKLEEVEKKIKIFEEIVVPRITKLQPPSIKKIFLAVDSHVEASEVSENALQITLSLAKRFQSEVYVACIAPTNDELIRSERLVNKIVQLLESENISVKGGCSSGRPSEHILELSRLYNPNLIVMPIPYGERAENYQIESLGATVDIVIRKSPFPILLVRKPKFKPNELTKYMVLLINEMENTEAAEFALALGERDSKLEILSVTKKETVERVEDIAENLTDFYFEEGTLESMHKREIQSLINGIFDEAKARGIIIERTHLVDNRIKAVIEQSKHEHTMIVLPTILIDGNILEPEVENLARFSKIPVLIVKT
jgi:nucleotide-binding universal stress UspA family protein